MHTSSYIELATIKYGTADVPAILFSPSPFLLSLSWTQKNRHASRLVDHSINNHEDCKWTVLLMKMSGTGQKGIGERNYSILIRYCGLQPCGTRHFLPLIFLRLRWFAPRQRYTLASRTLLPRSHVANVLCCISRVPRAFDILAGRIARTRDSVARRNLLSISYYSRKTCLFQSEVASAVNSKLYEANAIPGAPLNQLRREDYSNFAFYKCLSRVLSRWH